MVSVQKFIRGQGLIEFALVLPVLLILVVGVLDFGMAFFVKVQLENSAREGANYMTFHHTDSTSVADTKSVVQTEGQNAGITIATANITVTCLQTDDVTVDSTCSSGSIAVVTAKYPMSLAFDIFHNGPLQLMGDARMLIP